MSESRRIPQWAELAIVAVVLAAVPLATGDSGHYLRLATLALIYMAWTVAEGGAPFGSDMPAFADTLSESDRWAVIAYIRNGLSAELRR